MTSKFNNLVFIDESGDPGFKVDRGSSRYFVIALIIFTDQLEAEETALIIKKHRRENYKNDNFEFKFNKLNHKRRKDFLETIKNCGFMIRAIVIKKDIIYSSELRNHKAHFYNYFLKQVLDKSENIINDAQVYIDGRGDKLFRRELQTYLKKKFQSY